MICYASRTGTRRNLEALAQHDWRLLISRAGVWRTEGAKNIAAENGAWADYQAGRDFDEDEFEEFLDWLPITPDWIVLPDIVAGGHRSLALSLRYRNRCAAVSPLILLAVQDGILPVDVAPYVGTGIGIFLGGTTAWKLRTARAWGRFCAKRDLHFHFARANSIKRISLAVWAAGKRDPGKVSFDGTSATRFAVTTAKLTYAARQGDLFA